MRGRRLAACYCLAAWAAAQNSATCDTPGKFVLDNPSKDSVVLVTTGPAKSFLGAGDVQPKDGKTVLAQCDLSVLMCRFRPGSL